MKNIARQYCCAFCCKKVAICSACDRGNIYCDSTCSKKARKISMSQAGRKYQKKQKGKVKHAERQKRYYLLHCQKIRIVKKMLTHQGSKSSPIHVLLPPIIDKPRVNAKNNIITLDTRCNFCGNTIDKRAFNGTHT